jgi:multimeric flavodoxin WrbA/protein-tyrosine-phosphatase
MLVLGLQGSPRKKGNTEYLLSAFMDEAENAGAQTRVFDVARMNIEPCRGCGYCEKNGYCIIKDDDMTARVYPALREADAVVVAAPVFFYNVPSQLKALIDRSQTLWARKYFFKLTDPGAGSRRGFFLSQGATKGRNLFEGIHLTMKYYFDAVSADYSGSLTYRQVENRGDMEKHPTVLKDVKNAARELSAPLIARKRVLFACRENACRSQMTAAIARHLAGGKIDVSSAGSEPAAEINPLAAEVMQEKGIDMAFRGTLRLVDAIKRFKPELIVTMGCGEACPFVPGAERRDWDLPDPSGKSMDFMRGVRDEIEKRVEAFVGEFASPS